MGAGCGGLFGEGKAVSDWYWYETYEHLVAVGEHLVREGVVTTAEGLQRYYAEPWAFTETWESIKEKQQRERNGTD